jgi:phosphoribosylformylglycinamidine synthase
MVGYLPDARDAGRLGFANAGDQIALLGAFSPAAGACELAKLRGEPLPDGLPKIDIAAAIAAQAAVRESVRAGALSSAHDIAEGGLAVALAECCLAGGLGAVVELTPASAGDGDGGEDGDDAVTEALFGEASGGFLVSGPADAIRALGERVPVRPIGVVGSETLTIEIAGRPSGASFALTLDELSDVHSRGLAEFFA